ncbi:hypothetical protein FA15DRAFT_663612 [Coprinopsis marcescibilis]|uniref:Transmembrane protein n=1 Tax=Coprinopsis marcescibilis TaxID=230819 RepID=A0A5C3LBR5_COPMA|nr:hypothetical protein FA15DRAFT_663612 [Coprinopsis marcescibilis]
MSRLRSVFFDDTDQNINYNGQWDQDFEQYTDDVGLVFRGSQQRSAGAASMSFSFIGTSIAALGRSHMIEGGPEWKCYVDGEEIDRVPLERTTPVNNYKLCNTTSLTPTRHQFSLEVEASEETPFWLDRLSITPVQNMSYTNHYARIGPLDPSLLYVAGQWVGAQERYTTQPGSAVLVSFNGTRLTWITKKLTDEPRGISSGVYTLDNNPPVPFNITGRGSKNEGLRVLFETEQFPPGPHRLNATFLGFSAPLVLDSVWVENGDVLTPEGMVVHPDTVLGNDSESGNGGSGGGSGQSKPNRVGVIVGGALGGLAGLVLLAGLMFYFYKRWRRGKEKAAYLDVANQFTATGYQPNSYTQLGPLYGGPVATPYFSVPSTDLDNQQYGPYTKSELPDQYSYPPTQHAGASANPGPSLSWSVSDGEPSTGIAVGARGTSEKARLANSLRAVNASETMNTSGTLGGTDSSNYTHERSTSDGSIYPPALAELVRRGDSSDLPQLLQHRDSGLRIPQKAVEELPPTYTQS